MKLARFLAFAAAAALALPALASERHPDGIGFYVGLDGLQTLSRGTYAGLPNPNAGRLTLLFDHDDHFHGIGAYSYAGPAPHPAVLSTNANNRIPETYTLEPPLPLTPGSGLYSGRLRSTVGASEYSFLGIASIQSLAGGAPGSDQDILFNSSGGRWNAPLTGVNVGLKLLSATPGLHVGTETVANLFGYGSDTILLGPGNSLEFKPVYWVDAAAAPGTYSASFQLVNLAAASPFGDSGVFHFDFAVPVPEPGTYAMLLAGLAVLGLIARRRVSAG
jgi:hypothetical protein